MQTRLLLWFVCGACVLGAPLVSAAPRKGKQSRVRWASASQRKKWNTPDKDGKTALMRACSYPDADLKEATRLLKAGADPNVQNARGETALMLVVGFPPTSVEEMPDFARVLLRYKANPNLQDANGDTALMVACREHRVEGQDEAWAQADAINDALPEAYAKVVFDLRRMGARVDIRNKAGQNALDLALAARMGSSRTLRPEVVAALKSPLK